MTQHRGATYVFVIPGPPRPWQVWTRQSAPTKGNLECRAYQDAIRAYVRSKWVERGLLAGPLHLECEIYRALPYDAPKRPANLKAWIHNHVQLRPDGSNYFKAAEDALQGILFANDAQVVSWSGLKWYDVRPNEGEGYTIIRVRQL